MLIAIGVYQFIIGGFELPGTAGLMGRISGDSAIATFALGAVYGVAGFCAGPILGGVLTIAATSGGALSGGVLLFVYALGMAVPLFILAVLWERIGPWARARVSAGEWRIGPWRRPRVTVVSSAMFVLLGIAFIVFQGSNAFSGFYEELGAADLAASVETAFGELARSADDTLVIGLVTLAIGSVVIVALRSMRSRREDAHDHEDDGDLGDGFDDEALIKPT